jgi:hypothetical protein
VTIYGFSFQCCALFLCLSSTEQLISPCWLVFYFDFSFIGYCLLFTVLHFLCLQAAGVLIIYHDDPY